MPTAVAQRQERVHIELALSLSPEQAHILKAMMQNGDPGEGQVERNLREAIFKALATAI
jgi:hypothetical protein